MISHIARMTETKTIVTSITRLKHIKSVSHFWAWGLTHLISCLGSRAQTHYKSKFIYSFSYRLLTYRGDKSVEILLLYNFYKKTSEIYLRWWSNWEKIFIYHKRNALMNEKKQEENWKLSENIVWCIFFNIFEHKSFDIQLILYYTLYIALKIFIISFLVSWFYAFIMTIKTNLIY